jgi:hypothetical protein
MTALLMLLLKTTYIITALHDLKRSQRERLRVKVNEAKEQWIMK